MWIVEIGDEFLPEFTEPDEQVRTEILAHSRLLQQFGPHLGRPRVDTLKDSRHANVKELTPPAAFGAWLLLLIPSARPFCSLRATNQA